MLKQPVLYGLGGLGLLACAAPIYGAQKFTQFPVRQANDYKISAQQDGVSVAIQPVESRQDQMTYFHIELSPKGFLPVFVVIHNGSKVDSLLLDESGIRYGLGGSKAEGPNENIVGRNAGIASTALVPLLGGFAVVGAFVAAGMARDASEVSQNMILQQLQSCTLSPGETAHGFLFIPIPKKGPQPKLQIQVPIAWAGSDKTSVVHLNF